MSQQYLVPITQQTINGQSVFAPKYVVAAQLSFANIPYGGENTVGLVSLAQPNAALNQPDHGLYAPGQTPSTVNAVNMPGRRVEKIDPEDFCECGQIHDSAGRVLDPKNRGKLLKNPKPCGVRKPNSVDCGTFSEPVK